MPNYYGMLAPNEEREPSYIDCVLRPRKRQGHEERLENYIYNHKLLQQTTRSSSIMLNWTVLLNKIRKCNLIATTIILGTLHSVSYSFIQAVPRRGLYV